MARIQIFARTMLTILALYAVVVLVGYYSYLPRMQELSLWQELLACFACITLAIGIVYFLSFNHRLYRKIVGADEAAEPQAQPRWLVESLRIGLVFAGLMLLPRSVPVLIRTAKLFFLIRPAVSDIIVSKTVPDILKLSYAQWYRTIYEFLKAVLAIYLLCGAPYFLRWQMRHSPRAQSATKQTEIADAQATNSKG
jgi:hypothetical protein